MSKRIGVMALVLGVGASAGCSLLNLDQFPLATCSSNADCEVVNTAHGIAAGACSRYQCIGSTMSASCVLAPLDADHDGDRPISCGGTDCDDGNALRAGANVMAHEVCDGVDNDCNNVIDEGVVQPRTSQSVLADAMGVTSVSYAAAPTDGVVALTQSTRGAGWNTLSGTAVSPTAVQPVTYAYQAATTNDVTAYDEPALAAGCLVSDFQTLTGVSGTCGATDLVAGSADASGYSVVAAISASGCPQGQLRVGFNGPDDPGDAFPHPSSAEIVERGPLLRSNLAYGVDTDFNHQHCTGLTQAAHGGMYGAARPSVAALTQTTPPQALVAYLGGPVMRGACTDVQVPVEALGVWVSSGTTPNGAAIHWVNGTGSGIPDVVGQTTGGGRPGLAAWGAAAHPGYFLGFGNTAHQVELHFVAGLGAPPTPPTDTFPVYTPSATTSLAASIEAPLQLATMGGGAADHVVIQPGASDANGVDLGVSWIEGCGARSTVLFERLHYLGGVGGTPGTWTHDAAPVVLDTSAMPVSATLAYVPTGFVLAGYARGGATATAQNAGGWVVGWVGANGHFLARRLAALDGQPIAESNLDVSPTATGAVVSPDLYPGDATHPDLLRYVYASGNGLVGGDLLCGDGTTFP